MLTLKHPRPAERHHMMNGCVWQQHDNRSSQFKRHKDELQEGKGTLIKMSPQSDYLARQCELLFPFREFRELGLACSVCWHPPVHHTPGFSSIITLQTTGLDILNSDPKHSGSSLRFPLSSLCLWSGTVCLSCSIARCLFAWHLSGLAYFLLDLISQCEVLWRPSPNLPLRIPASPAPVSAVRDWLTPTLSPVFAPGPTGQQQHISQNRQSHLHAHKSLKKGLTLCHTTSHNSQS